MQHASPLAAFRRGPIAWASAIPGIVGAGGVGVALETALNLLYFDHVAVVLMGIFAMVIRAEVVVSDAIPHPCARTQRYGCECWHNLDAAL